MSYCGHAALVAAIHARLGRPDARLITLIGPGGVGKTRHAIGIAAELRATGQAAFPKGVIFMSLAAVIAPALVDTAIAVALGLRDRRMLLVLDNAERVVATAWHTNSNSSAPALSIAQNRLGQVHAVG